MKILNNYNKLNYCLLGVVIIGAGLLRIMHIDFQSLWLDEIHSFKVSNPFLSFSDFYRQLKYSAHPPLYFALLKTSLWIFGYKIIVLKLFSAIVGIVGVWAIYLLGKELFSSKVGIYAAIITSVNYFHIFYSQEARMYSLFFLTVVFSLYFLVRFVRKPNYKSALFYAIASTMLINTHFFGFFTLAAEYVFILVFILSKSNFKYCLVAFLTTVFMFTPTLGLLKETANIKSMWIQIPSSSVYTQIFRTFFGNAEFVITIVVIASILFFVRLGKESAMANKDVTEDNFALSASLIITLIILSLVLPLIRTYTALPIIVDRYFINVLPLIILLVALGLNGIVVSRIRHLLLGILVVSSVFNTIYVREYYKKVNKTQFREVSTYIKENTQIPEPVVSSLSWYYSAYLQENKNTQNLVEKPLDDYLHSLKNDSTIRLKSFWYCDAHGRPFNVNTENAVFLNANFIVTDSIDLFDSWAKHYKVKEKTKL